MATKKAVAPTPEPKVDAELLRYIREQYKLAIDIEAAEAQIKPLKRRYDELREKLVPDAMDAAGVHNINIKGIGRVSVTADMRVSVIAGQIGEVKQWLEDNGHNDLISETVNSSTLKAFLKGMIKEGGTIPDGLFNLHQFSRASITKS